MRERTGISGARSKMRFQNLCIESIATEIPPRVVESSAIEDSLEPTLRRLKLPLRPIEALTGIRSRRFWEPGEAVYAVAARAGRLALDKAGVRKDQVGVLISTSVSREFLEPSTASVVHGVLGLPSECRNFDVSNACLGFLDGMTLAGQLIEAGVVDYALVVDGESAEPILQKTVQALLGPDVRSQDFWSQFATLTLGSAAVGMVLTHARHSRTGHRVEGLCTRADTANSHLCRGTADRMETDSIRLLRAGVELARRCWGAATEELHDWHPAAFRQFICHQVGKAHMAAIADALNIPQDRCFASYPLLGNVGPAAVPITLGMAVDQGVLQPGDRAALMGIGSGLNVTMMAVRW